jgi:hypothetical protein
VFRVTSHRCAAMHVKHNNEVCSHSHFYFGKAIRNSYPECVSADLVIQNGRRMNLTVICDLSGSTVHFTDYLVHVTVFVKKLLIIKYVL